MKKNKTKRKSILHRHLKKSYPAHAFAVILVIVVFVEGMVFGGANANDLKAGIEILDMSESFTQTKADLETLAEPFSYTIRGVNGFYEMSSEETMHLLENNIITHIGTLLSDISKFYSIASTEMASALDLSDQLYPTSAYAFSN